MAAKSIGEKIAVIASGERWPQDGAFRPALEDYLGAGAILSYLDGAPSADARVARTVFDNSRDDLFPMVLGCPSGYELDRMGYRVDIELATQLNVDDQAAVIIEGAYQAVIVS